MSFHRSTQDGEYVKKIASTSESGLRFFSSGASQVLSSSQPLNHHRLPRMVRMSVKRRGPILGKSSGGVSTILERSESSRHGYNSKLTSVILFMDLLDRYEGKGTPSQMILMILLIIKPSRARGQYRERHPFYPTCQF